MCAVATAESAGVGGGGAAQTGTGEAVEPGGRGVAGAGQQGLCLLHDRLTDVLGNRLGGIGGIRPVGAHELLHYRRQLSGVAAQLAAGGIDDGDRLAEIFGGGGYQYRLPGRSQNDRSQCGGLGGERLRHLSELDVAPCDHRGGIVGQLGDIETALAGVLTVGLGLLAGGLCAIGRLALPYLFDRLHRTHTDLHCALDDLGGLAE